LSPIGAYASVGQEETLRRVLEPWSRPLARGLVLILGLVFLAPPAAIAEPLDAPAAKAPLTAATQAKVAAIQVPPRALAQAAPATTGEKKGFFKSKVGIAAIVLMAAGTGVMVHSAFTDNDPVKSPIR
jgi:hypothetical protein